jgi:hypothetical protein
MFFIESSLVRCCAGCNLLVKLLLQVIGGCDEHQRSSKTVFIQLKGRRYVSPNIRAFRVSLSDVSDSEQKSEYWQRCQRIHVRSLHPFWHNF